MANDEIILRLWEITDNANINIDSLELTIREFITALGLKNVGVIRGNDYGAEAISMYCMEKSDYMKVHNYFTQVEGSNVLITSVLGKGQQVKAKDLESMYVKARMAWSTFSDDVKFASSKNRGASYTVGAAVGTAAGMAIAGSFKLAAKGVRALLRDKEAYEKEMDYYKLALGICDLVCGGQDSQNLMVKLIDQGNANNVLAQYYLGIAYRDGSGVGIHLDEAVKWFDRAAANGEMRSRMLIADEYLFSDKAYDIAKKQVGLKYLEEIADSGDSDAIEAIINVYTGGIVKGINSNCNIALKYAEKYSSNNEYAMITLAQLLDPEIEIENMQKSSISNVSRAISIYTKLAGDENGQYKKDAAYRLATRYENGMGVTKDTNKAIEYYQIAANDGDIPSKAKMMEAFAYGIGVTKSNSTAQNYCQQVINKGSSDLVTKAYYIMHIIADEERRYGDSIKHAKNYIARSEADPDKKEELTRYVADQESKLSGMSKKERKEYLKETGSGSSSSSGGGGCYVATAVYGSYDCPEVWTLRRFRDYTLAETWYGRAFIKTYYAVSPTIVKWFGSSNWFTLFFRKKLDILVSKLLRDGVENTPYNDRKYR